MAAAPRAFASEGEPVTGLPERDELRRLAEAVPFQQWQAHFTIHGDPMVVPSDVPLPTRRILDVSTGGNAGDDYGRALCEFIGATDPETVLSLLAALDTAEQDNARLRKDNEALEHHIVEFTESRHKAERDRLRVQLAAVREKINQVIYRMECTAPMLASWPQAIADLRKAAALAVAPEEEPADG
jgi:hypothetical protein